RLKRWADRAASSSIPQARSTCEGRETPAEQAEPVEVASPRASRPNSSESPSQPGNVKWALAGRRPRSEERRVGKECGSRGGGACTKRKGGIYLAQRDRSNT